MAILLPVVLFITWLAIILVPAGGKAIRGEKKGIPEGQRGGVEIFPGIPVMPLLFWALAWVVDRFYAGWGTWSVLAFHLIILPIAVFVIVRDIIRLRRIGLAREQQQSGRQP